ncbi:unnamed protein product [Caenorhabditis brenneri]
MEQPATTKIIYQDEGDATEQYVTDRLRPSYKINTTQLYTIKDLNALGFYKALRELYLTGGFDIKLNFNKAILGATVIPDMQWQQAIRALEQTRFEIKGGETSWRRIQGMIKLNEPDSLIREPWLMDLVMLIMEKSVNPKNVAYSIRDLGVALMENGSTRDGYTNGTDLRKFLKTWELTELTSTTEKSTPFNWTEHLLIIHHTIGPENFNALGDILESLPWQTFGVYSGDSEYLRFYRARLLEAILDADVAEKVLKALYDGYQNATQTYTAAPRVIDELALAELIPRADLPIFVGVTGGMVPVDGGATPDRFERAQGRIGTLWGEIPFKEETKALFSKAAGAALETQRVGGLEGIKNALLAGARLSKHLGSPEKAIEKCQELQKMILVDSIAQFRFNYALEVVKNLNYTKDGVPGYEMLLEMYFGNKALWSTRLFEGTRLKTLEEMQTFFKAMTLDPSTNFLQLITILGKAKYTYREFQGKLQMVQNDLRNFRRAFQFEPTSQENGLALRSALQSLLGLSKDDTELLGNIRSVREILRTEDPKKVLETLGAVSLLSRDRRWQDVADALGAVYTVTQGPSSTFAQRTAPFKGVPRAPGAHLEVYLSLQSLLEVPEFLEAKCKFIEDFYGPGTAEIAMFGVDLDKIQMWNQETSSNEALIQLLRAVESRAALGRLISFHNAYTTNTSDPYHSMAMIGDMALYLEGHNWRE